MNGLDLLAGWAAANEEQLRAFVEQLDELVADGVPAAVELAERVRRAKAEAWAEGTGDQAAGCADVNPYVAWSPCEAGEFDGS